MHITDIGIHQDLRMSLREKRGTGLNFGLLVLQVFLAFFFIVSGGNKLFDTDSSVETFKGIGLGQWLRYLTGWIEVFGAITLWNPLYGFWGAILLAVTMVGSIVIRHFILGISSATQTGLLVLLVLVIWGNREQIKRVLKM